MYNVDLCNNGVDCQRNCNFMMCSCYYSNSSLEKEGGTDGEKENEDASTVTHQIKKKK